MAGSTTVGVLRALLTADTSAFDAAMASASAKTQAWSTDFTKLGLSAQQVGQVFTDSLARSLSNVNNLAKQFSGANIAKAADEYAAAIQRVGGVSQLTEAEQAKINKLMTEAVAKYEALGQTAPAHLVALKNATQGAADHTQSLSDQLKAAIPSTQSMSGEIQKLALGYVAGAVSAEGLVSAGEKLFDFYVDSIKAYTAAEDAQRKLTTALEANGQAAPEVSAEYGRLASQYAATTVNSRNLLKETEALLVEVGGVAPGQMDQALRAATDLAAGLGIDLRSATLLVGKAFEDNFTSLKKAGVQIDATRAAAEGMTYVLGQIEARFGGQAQSEAAGYSGEMKRLANTWDELQARFGETVLQMPEVKNGLALIESYMKSNEEQAKKTGVAFSVMSDDFNRALALGMAKGVPMPKSASFGQDVALPGPPPSFTAQLAAARQELDKLTEADRQMLAAGIAVNASFGDMQKALTAQHPDITLTVGLFNLLKEQLQQQKEATRQAADEAQRYAADLSEHEEIFARMSALVSGASMTTGEWAEALLKAGASLSDVRAVTGLATGTLEGYKKTLSETATAQEKYANDTLAAEQRIQQLDDDTSARQLKASGDALGAKLANIEKEFNAEVAKNQQLAVSDEELERLYEAALRNRQARIDQANAEELQKDQARDAAELEAHQKALDAMDAADLKSRETAAALWDKYNALELKGRGDTLESELRANQAAGDRQQMQLVQNLSKELAAIRNNDALGLADKVYYSQQAIATAANEAAALGKITQAEADAIVKAFDLRAVQASFQNLAAAAGGSFGQVVQSIGSGVSAILRGDVGALEQGIQTLRSDGTHSGQEIATAWVQVATSIASAVVDIAQFGKGMETATKSTIVMTDTMEGAKIGTEILPGWGTLAGAGIGALVGALTTPQWEKAEHDVGNEMGINISKGVALGLTQVEVDVKKMDASLSDNVARHYAELLSLDQIIANQGGLNALNISKWADQSSRLFEVIQRGGQLGAAGVKELTTMIGLLADAESTTTGEWSQSFTDLLNTTARFNGGIQILEQNWDKLVKSGTDGVGLWNEGLQTLAHSIGSSATVQAALDQQMANAAKGVATAIGVTSDAYTAQQKDLDTLADLQQQYADATSDDQRNKIKKSIDETNADLKIQSGIIAATTVHSQEAAAAVASALVGSVAGEIAAGKSFTQAIRDQTPAILSLRDQLKATGLDGGKMFDGLLRSVDIVNDKVAGPALTAIEGYTAGIVGLSNAGQLSTSDFAGLADQIGATEQALEAQGKTRADVLPAMASDLQVIWEQQQKNHAALDEYTQGLVDEAVQDGLVGESHKSVADQMLDLTTRMAVAIEGLAHAFGVTLPRDMDAAAKAASGVKDAVNDIPTDITVSVGWDVSAPPPEVSGPSGSPTGDDGSSGAPSAANEGFFSRPTMVRVGDAPGERGEYVIHASHFDRLQAAYRMVRASASQMAATIGSFSPPTLVPPTVPSMAVAALASLPPALSTGTGLAVPAGGGMTTAIIQIDGRTIARATFPHTPGEARRYGLTRA